MKNLPTWMRSAHSTSLLEKIHQYSPNLSCRMLSHKVMRHRLRKFNRLAPERNKLLNQAVDLNLCKLSSWLSLATLNQPIHQRRTRMLTIPMRRKPKKPALIGDVTLLFCMRKCLQKGLMVKLSLWIRTSSLVLTKLTSKWSKRFKIVKKSSVHFKETSM